MDAAGYATVSAGDPRAGVVLGTYSAGGQATREYLEGLFKGGPSGAPALLFNSTVGNAAAGLAGLEFKLCGPNATISQKESSGLAAIATAVDLLRLGRADHVAAGGMDAIYDLLFRGHDRFNVMSDAHEAGESTSPFARSRRGFILGEGAYVLWLRSSSSFHVRAEMLGVAASSAACGINLWPDDPGSIVRTMSLALEDAGLTPGDVSVIYASANSTPTLDNIEARAITELFGSRPVVTSIKGAIGECSAAGAASCAAAVLCGALGKVPPIVQLRDAEPVAATLNLARAAVDAPGPITLVNSVASGGAVYSAVLRTPPVRPDIIPARFQ
jgi:3-oxoacyl-[acyl-carrier-protein] synthase II